jgi:asparagine synthase (glutamine-hydrolysing)
VKNRALGDGAQGIAGDRTQSRPWVDSGADAPFVAHVCDAGEVTQRGQPVGFVGHQMVFEGDSRPHGLWGEWAWDGQTLTAQVDPLGYFSLFVYAKGGEVAVSPSILQLLAQGADAEVDDVALAVFHRLGLFVGNDTPFTHIKVLPPHGKLTWSQGVGRVEGGEPVPRVRSITREAAVEAFIELPRATVRKFLRHWDGPIALPLSGGRDSRHILLEMAYQGRKPDTCVTFHHGGKTLNDEVLAARAVAQHVGVRHAILGHPRQRLRDSVRGLLMTQLCADEHAQMMPMHDFLSGSAAAAIDGIGGDILTNPDDCAAGFMEQARRGEYEAIARRLVDGHGGVICRGGQAGSAGTLFSPDLAAAAIARIADAVRTYDAAPDPYQAFWFYHRTRREISFTSTGIMGGSAMVFCPYLAPDFVELGLSLPWPVTSDQKLHDDAIFRAFPKAASIPFASGFTSQPMPSLRLSRITNALDTLKIAAMVAPGSGARGIRKTLAPTPLLRAKSDIYRLHHEFVTQMSTTEAQRLQALSRRLSDDAPKGDKVVSHVYSGH